MVDREILPLRRLLHRFVCFIVPLLMSILRIQLVQSKVWALLRNRHGSIFLYHKYMYNEAEIA